MVEIVEPPVYLPLGETQMDRVLARILKDEPDLIINTINGDTNTSFFGFFVGSVNLIIFPLFHLVLENKN